MQSEEEILINDNNLRVEFKIRHNAVKEAEKHLGSVALSSITSIRSSEIHLIGYENRIQESMKNAIMQLAAKHLTRARSERMCVEHYEEHQEVIHAQALEEDSALVKQEDTADKIQHYDLTGRKFLK